MSDLRPRGVPVEVCGEKRYLLFTLNAVEAVQAEFDAPVLDALDTMSNDEEKRPLYVRKILHILLESEADRTLLTTGKELRRFTEKEVGMLFDYENMMDVVLIILQALNLSMPESSGEDSDPN